MSIYCPHCNSINISRAIQPQHPVSNHHSSLSSAASFATIGASLSKHVSFGVSPLFGGIAGAVVGSVLGGIFNEPSQPRSTAAPCFQCDDCLNYFY